MRVRRAIFVPMKEAFFTYYEGDLGDFIDVALATKDKLIKRIISKPTESLIHDLIAKGIEIDHHYRHTLDNNAIRHSLKKHGSKREELRGQIPIICHDFLKIPAIVSSYDSLRTDKNKRGQDLIIYSKSFDQDNTYYVEEIRLGRHELAACTIYKRKKDLNKVKSLSHD